MLGVAYPSEGLELRNAGETRKILIIIPPEVDEISEIIENNLDITIGHIEHIEEINFIAKRKNARIKAHIYINSGMNRDGISPVEFKTLVQNLKNYNAIDFEGVCTHLAASDFDDKTFANQQINTFKELISFAENFGVKFKYIHSANSGAIASLPNSHFNLVRPGIALHGLMPRADYANLMNLKPTLSLKTHIKKIHKIKKKDTVGYSFKYIAPNSTKIAVIPIGYGDGVTCNLTNNAQCLIRGKRFNLVGSICMDQMFIDIKNENINEGEQVVLIGKQGADEISVYEIAKQANTIPYEITTSILKRVPRIFVENNV
jgi:alanine racemase